MEKFILGLKLGMSQIFQKGGEVIPVTLIEAGPCYITQIKTNEKDKYRAIQIGFIKKAKKIKKTEKGKEFKYLKEFQITNSKLQIPNLGDKIDASVFQEGDKVKVAGISKGKGFQGAVKRWGFHGRPKTRGTKHELRTLGSTGMAGHEKVMKGRKMPGRMGSERTTIRNLEIVKIDKENNLLAVKGAIPGRKGTLLEISNFQ